MTPQLQEALCLYCNTVTGRNTDGLPTVCGNCQFSARDEAREVAAGLRPWARPVRPLLLFLGQKPMPDAAAAQAKWDAEQEQIRDFNERHSGNVRPRVKVCRECNEPIIDEDPAGHKFECTKREF